MAQQAVVNAGRKGLVYAAWDEGKKVNLMNSIGDVG